MDDFAKWVQPFVAYTNLLLPFLVNFVVLLWILIIEIYVDQVNNRDISIAVLRTFISKRKQEHEAKLSKRTKAAKKVSEEDASEPLAKEAPTESDMHEEKSNGECAVPEETSLDEPHCISEEPVGIMEEKGQGQLKPPRVLEVHP